MNTNTIIANFKKLDSDFIIYEDAASYILKWFMTQKKLPQNKKGLKCLVKEIYDAYDEGVDLDELVDSEVLTLEYWGGDFYPENPESDWNAFFATKQKCFPHVWMIGGPGKFDESRFEEEKKQFLEDMK